MDVRKLEIQTGEFDPIRQHRHFCPWINSHVATATSSTRTGTLCGWQMVLDALQKQHGMPGSVESELTASKHKVFTIFIATAAIASLSVKHNL